MNRVSFSKYGIAADLHMKMSEVLVFILRVGTNFLYCSSPIQRRATFEGDAQAAGDKA